MILFLVLCVIFIVPCCKHSSPKTIIAPKEILDYAYFKKGTWWVYEDSVSKKIDSVCVYENHYRIDTVFESNKHNNLIGYFDAFECITLHSFHGYTVNYYYTPSAKTYTSESYPGDKRYTIYSERYLRGVEFNGPTSAIGYPFDEWWTSLQTYKLKAKLDTFSLNGNTFHEVYVIHDTDNDLWPPNPYYNWSKMVTETYWARNIGIVKMTMKNDSINYNWQIKNYHIVQ